MNQRTAKREAHGIVAQLIESYLGVGQPYDDYENQGLPPDDADRIAMALEAIRDRHFELGHLK